MTTACSRISDRTPLEKAATEAAFFLTRTQAPAVVLPLRAIGCDNARSLLPAQVWVDSESTANFAFVAKMWAVVSQSQVRFERGNAYG